MTYRDVVTNALRELNVIDAEDSPSAPDASFVLGKLNRIFDRWNGLGLASYVDLFFTPTLTPSLQPHTLGPTGTFWTAALAIRPDAIAAASRFDGTIKVPITMRDEAWWIRQPTPSLTGSFVTDLYYQPTYPDGSLYFWPVPSAAIQLELVIRQGFLTGTLNTDFALPPGFEDAVTLTLAEEIAEAFGATPGPKLVQSALNARAQLFSRHGKRYPLKSDFGVRQGAHWDYRTGTYR